MMKFFNLFALLFFSLILITHNKALGAGTGNSSSYSFSGACGSQGTWTQNALTATQNLRKITLQLRDDPNCSSLATNMQAALASLKAGVDEAGGKNKKALRLSQIPKELSALRTYAQSNPQGKNNILKLIMNTAVEGAGLGALVVKDEADAANMLMDLGERVKGSTQTGIDILNQVVDDLPQLNECLVNDKTMAMGQFLSSTVQLASAFTSSGEEGVGSKLAVAVSKITKFVRNNKFSKVLRKLNQQEFMTSMSCLLEVTSESYCQARESMGLFNTAMSSFKMKKLKTGKSGIKEDVATNPFTGYYILNTHVPNITRWMQKIQIGVDPKLPTDAHFQNGILQEVTDFYKDSKTILGDFNKRIMTVKTLSSLEQKQLAVLQLLISTTNTMTGGNKFRNEDDKVNFFVIAKNAVKIPFYLMGMDNVPDQVMGKTVNGVFQQQQAFDQWLTINMPTLPIFNDPLALAETIRRNMTTLIKEANIAAIEYFNVWYIVDKEALVNESLTDVNYTVKESLQSVQKFLEIAKNRVIRYNGDPSALPIIMDTQVRIDNILKAYAKIEALGNQWKKLNIKNGIDPKFVQSSGEIYTELINTVYEQFNVMYSRSGFLANRMVTFVNNDYNLLLKNGINFTAFQKELFLSQGMAAFDRMLLLYEGNPANVKTDLNMALEVNSGNLDALEMLISDSLVGTIADIKLKAERSGNTSMKPIPFFSTLNRVIEDSVKDSPNYYSSKSPTGKIRMSVIGMINSPIFQYWKHSDRYRFFNDDDEKSSFQSEFDESEGVLAQLCLQSLAFSDEGPYEELCKGSGLKNPFYGTKEKEFNYEKVLLSHLKDESLSQKRRIALNHSDRVCAFRNYNRKIMVQYMEISKDKKR